MPLPFTVAFTADFHNERGEPTYRDVGFSLLDANPRLARRVFSKAQREIDANQVGSAQGVILMTQRVTAATVSRADDLLVIARFGVGYDNVDVAACTAANVLVTITVGAVDRPVAEATVGWMIALSHHLLIKDRLVRTGAWDERSKYMGRELRDRVIGFIGFGGIAREAAGLLRGFRPRELLAYDPFPNAAVARALGVRLVSLDELLTASDFVSIHCPLNASTRGLIGARELGLMRPDAYLLNTARGGIVDEAALVAALKARRIAGAAVDCFAEEPVTRPHPLAECEGVLLAPHSIAWTEELFRDMGHAACGVMVDLADGRAPRGVLNPEVLDRPAFREKWRRFSP